MHDMSGSRTVSVALQAALDALDNFQALNILEDDQYKLWAVARDNIRKTMALTVAIEALD